MSPGILFKGDALPHDTGLFLNYFTGSIAALRQARDVVLCVTRLFFIPNPIKKVTGFTRFLRHLIRLRGGGSAPRPWESEPPPEPDKV
jgi:hypothetical protein